MDLDYRWYPEGKVIFVAPTKPLVAQQVGACLETCGIPGRDSVELTGEVPKVQRVKHVRIIVYLHSTGTGSNFESSGQRNVFFS